MFLGNATLDGSFDETSELGSNGSVEPTVHDAEAVGRANEGVGVLLEEVALPHLNALEAREGF
jgi:hypothetical protein